MINQEAVEALKRENDQLKALIVQKDQILHQRGESQLCAVIDAMFMTAQLANQGHPGAQQIAERCRMALEAISSTSKIAVVRGPVNGQRPGG